MQNSKIQNSLNSETWNQPIMEWVTFWKENGSSPESFWCGKYHSGFEIKISESEGELKGYAVGTGEGTYQFHFTVKLTNQ